MVHAKQWLGQDHAEVEALLDGVSSAEMELADILDQEVGEIPDAQQIPGARERPACGTGRSGRSGRRSSFMRGLSGWKRKR